MPDYLPGAEPFSFPGNHIGCLLIHGFGGTPYEMRELGERLAGQGYTVSGPALAGHATCIEDMLQTRWTDWYTSVEATYRELTLRCDTIYAVGLSLGGMLVLHLAAHEPLDGVVAVSPPFEIRHRLIPLFRLFPFLIDLFPVVKSNPKDDDTRDPSVRARHPSYEGHATRCAESLVLHLLPHVRNDLPNVRAPALLIQSRGDRVIPPNSIEEIYARLGSADKEMLWLDNSGHLVLEDYAKEEAFARILHFVRAHAAIREPAPGEVLQFRNQVRH